MKILLIGASSYLGARLYLDISKNFDVVGTYASHPTSLKFIPLDLLKADEVKKVIKQVRPDIVIHAANNASAKWCEANPKEAIKLNQTSTQDILKASDSIGAKIIYISSLSATDLSNMYGKTKFESEKIIKLSKSGYLIVRPSLIIGLSPNTLNDRPFNRILKNLDEKTPAIYDTSWKFQPTYIRHLSEVITEAVKKNIWNTTITVCAPQIKSRFDIARDILTPFGIAVTPIDNHDKTIVLVDDLASLVKNNLPTYDYEDIIKNIIEEIKQREAFVLS